MTREELYSKSAIAVELAVRDMEIERLRAGLEKIVQGGYAEGADVAHPAIRIARATLDPQWIEKAKQRAESHYPTFPNTKLGTLWAENPAAPSGE